MLIVIFLVLLFLNRCMLICLVWVEGMFLFMKLGWMGSLWCLWLIRIVRCIIDGWLIDWIVFSVVWMLWLEKSMLLMRMMVLLLMLLMGIFVGCGECVGCFVRLLWNSVMLRELIGMDCCVILLISRLRWWVRVMLWVGMFSRMRFLVF